MELCILMAEEILYSLPPQTLWVLSDRYAVVTKPVVSMSNIGIWAIS